MADYAYVIENQKNVVMKHVQIRFSPGLLSQMDINY